MSKELNIDLGTTGLTVTANVYLLGVLKASGIACAEIGVTGKYAGDFTATPNVAGVYQVAFFVGAATTSAGGGQIEWDGSAEVHQTGDSFARLGAAGAGLTALGDTRIANLDAAVSSRSTYAGGAVASVTADVGITQAGADKVWGSAARTLTSFGTLVADAAAAVWASATRVLTAGTNIVLAKGTGVTGFNDPTTAAIADAVWDEATSGHATAGTTGAALSAAASHSTGIGALTWTYTVTSSTTGLPIADVDVWITSDSAGTNVLASGRTNQAGVATFYLDAGTVYVWRQKTGYDFTNPDTEVVS